MPASLRHQIEDHLSELDYGYHHLLLVIVPISTGKKRDSKQVATQTGLAYVNLGLVLCQSCFEM